MRWNSWTLTSLPGLLAGALLLCTPGLSLLAAQTASPPEYQMEMKEAWIALPDGVRLAADLYMPAGDVAGKKFPVILEYLPYRKRDGTIVRDAETHEQFGELVRDGDVLQVAQGGKGGWGNAKFKTSTNRAPRQFGPGLPGEKRLLELELKVIADVGLLGLPNAGKSTLIRAVSSARPKVADYPFTTLHPNLGVVYCGEHRSFVMADIPGLIEGAAEGAGLGIRFLKHLQRTRVLLHLVDISPLDPQADPVRDARAIIAELKKFSKDLALKPRWLILNKSDLLPPEEAERRAKAIVRSLRYKGPWFLISGATGTGTRDLTEAVMRFLEASEAPKATDDDA